MENAENAEDGTGSLLLVFRDPSGVTCSRRRLAMVNTEGIREAARPRSRT